MENYNTKRLIKPEPRDIMNLIGQQFGISAKVLTQNLRDLEKDGIIQRTVYPEVPPKVEYQLTEKGWELKGILDLMKEFGNKYKDK